MSDVRRRRTAAEPDNDDQGQGQAGDEAATSRHEKVQLMDLPDEMLVKIFTYLEMGQVLRLRAVCRRWRDLLLHPDVWRRREGDYFELNFVFGDAVLTLAPCLWKLYLVSCSRRPHYLASRGALVATTNCAVRSFHSLVDAKNACFVAPIIRNQAALGRLREVRLILQELPSPLPPDLRVLFKTLLEVEGLTSLDIPFSGQRANVVPPASQHAAVAALPSAVPRKTVRSSLVELKYALCLPDAVQEYLLRCHAATLEVVELSGFPRHGSSAPVAALLPEAPKLRALTCPVIPNMVLLKQCTALEHLHLDLGDTSDGDDLLRYAKPFLREATHLKKVELDFLLNDNANVGLVLEGVFGVLAASRCSEVESIVLHRSYGEVPLPAGVGGSLSGLPYLRSLNISSFSISSTFLSAITPLSAPSLRWLELKGTPGACAHAWIHSAPVSGMLQKNWKLHLKLVYCSTMHCGSDSGSACGVCRRGCHFIEEDDRKMDAKIIVFAHSNEGPPCSEEHDDVHVVQTASS